MPPHHHHPPPFRLRFPPLGLLALIWEFITYPQGQRLCWRYGLWIHVVVLGVSFPRSSDPPVTRPWSRKSYRRPILSCIWQGFKNLHPFHTKMLFRQGFIGYEVFSIRYGQQYLSHKQSKISFKYRDCLWGEGQYNGWFFPS